MNRRDWVKTWAAAGAVQVARGAAASANKVEAQIVRHKLKHTWTTTMSSSEFRDVLYLSFNSAGITGHGEGAPIVRYKENAEMAKQAVESVQPLLTSADPMQFAKVMGQVFAKVEGNYAAKAAIESH
jgi:Mandelate racemase / muconate lactonizing enzyme, N-terminal domain.